MKITDKLLDDKKRLNKTIDETVDKMEEYVTIIDALAKKVEFTKKVFEDIYEEHLHYNNEFSQTVAEKALQTLKVLYDD